MASSRTGPRLSRRDVLKMFGVSAGMAGLAACGEDSGGGGGGGGGSGSKEVTVGSNASDTLPKQAYEQVFANFQKASGITPKVNTVDHNTYQEQINNYLQGRPDDVWMWFAGYRMQFFAQRGLAGPVTDVWQKIGGNFTEALKQASTGLDGQ